MVVNKIMDEKYASIEGVRYYHFSNLEPFMLAGSSFASPIEFYPQFRFFFFQILQGG